MGRTLLFAVIVLSISTTCVPREKFDFAFIVGRCFLGDTLTIEINGTRIIQDTIARSDFLDGVTAIDIYQNEYELWVNTQYSKISFKKLEVDNDLVIKIKINGNEILEKIDLTKGRIVFVDNCKDMSEDGMIGLRKVKFRQYRKRNQTESYDLQHKP